MLTPTLDALPAELVDRILCYYINPSDRPQVARITNIENWYFERVVFPGQRLLFEAVREAELEIYASDQAVILTETIPCSNLQVMAELELVEEV